MLRAVSGDKSPGPGVLGRRQRHGSTPTRQQRGTAAGHVLVKASGERWPRCRLAGGAVNESVTYQYYLM